MAEVAVDRLAETRSGATRPQDSLPFAWSAVEGLAGGREQVEREGTLKLGLIWQLGGGESLRQRARKRPPRESSGGCETRIIEIKRHQ